MRGFGGNGVTETDRFWLTGQGDCGEYWDQEWERELRLRERELEKAPPSATAMAELVEFAEAA